jgi:hypothetical protein
MCDTHDPREANWQRFAFTFQQWLDRHCDGDETLLRAVLNYALNDAKYRKAAHIGPHKLRRDFTRILAEVKTIQATATAAPVTQHPVHDAAWLTVQIEAAIRRDVEDAVIPDDWPVMWLVDIQTLFDAGHGVETLQKVARFAINHPWWSIQLGKEGVHVLAINFEMIHAQYRKDLLKKEAACQGR